MFTQEDVLMSLLHQFSSLLLAMVSTEAVPLFLFFLQQFSLSTKLALIMRTQETHSCLCVFNSNSAAVCALFLSTSENDIKTSISLDGMGYPLETFLIFDKNEANFHYTNVIQHKIHIWFSSCNFYFWPEKCQDSRG